MSWEVVPDAEVPQVIAACQQGRCVSCYGEITQECPGEHGFYCCGCDDNDDCPQDCPDCRKRVESLWALAADEELPYDELPPEWEQRCIRHAAQQSST